MKNLYTIFDFTSGGYKIGSLQMSSVSAVFNSILVMVSKNPILSVLFLIGLFVSVSVYLLLIGASFLGLAYLLVYIGAISILFLFILMLINVRVSELVTDTNNSLPLILFTGVFIYESISFVMLSLESISSTQLLGEHYLLSVFILNNRDLFSKTNDVSIINGIDLFIDQLIELWRLGLGRDGYNIVGTFKTSANDFFNNLYQSFHTKIKFITSFMWDGNLTKYSHIAGIGNIMYTSHSIWLILTSIILLLAMVGSIIITITTANL